MGFAEIVETRNVTTSRPDEDTGTLSGQSTVQCIIIFCKDTVYTIYTNPDLNATIKWKQSGLHHDSCLPQKKFFISVRLEITCTGCCQHIEWSIYSFDILEDNSTSEICLQLRLHKLILNGWNGYSKNKIFIFIPNHHFWMSEGSLNKVY
jgi:hypothetical protein